MAHAGCAGEIGCTVPSPPAPTFPGGNLPTCVRATVPCWRLLGVPAPRSRGKPGETGDGVTRALIRPRGGTPSISPLHPALLHGITPTIPAFLVTVEEGVMQKETYSCSGRVWYLHPCYKRITRWLSRGAVSLVSLASTLFSRAVGGEWRRA